ncbi:putative multiple-sugar transport system permease YteP [Paenibacillus baekrokdamisoli]|uniref:Putative multiple-sugar transport system permease YteP n=1 Tax=Paenibacillus baekrokdamisoli TaxID=1712516 RepID=A0A3G9J6L9_9BACL|nr:ABC transporter permease subunit [Paenibacillus baekrokdamisoli]MBB3067395.1 putative aldouronate transport system permease protein [Paenibacillus baekrokdamisoli]BBH19418.1 putative multiple-sugar transport system permease YteP [Paenibacillus baekrokdamisoli]
MINNGIRMLKDMKRDRWIYILLVPGLIYLLLFKYLPMGGVVIAFQDYHPFKGFLGSDWVGTKHFTRLFEDPDFFKLLGNTLMLSLYNLAFGFPAPIILALMLNELRHMWFKRTIQTLIYIPHFMSWVVVVSMFFVIFESQDSMFQSLLTTLGFDQFSIMMDGDLFRPMYILQVIWRESGWGTVIYLAALASISPELYEAARMDGANRLRQIWHITLPGIRSTIIILLLLRLSDVLDLSFEHVYLLLNSLNREVGEVFDTYVYRVGLVNGQLSYATAVGLFKGLVGLVLVMIANWAAKKSGEEGIY